MIENLALFLGAYNISTLFLFGNYLKYEEIAIPPQVRSQSFRQSP